VSFSRTSFFTCLVVALGVAFLAAPRVSAQGVISVADTTGWTAWTTGSGAIMQDAPGDQQTGQGQDDFVGDATYAGFQQKAGTLNGADTVMFRARFNKYDGTNQWGNGGNFGLGMDLDGNGSVDLVMVMSEGSGNVNNRTRSITFATPGSGANDGPSTTSWTFPTQTAINLTAYSGSNGTTANYFLTGASDGSNFSGTPDAWLTFGISFANLQNAIRTWAKAPTGQAANFWSTYNLTYNSTIAFIAYSTQQTNAINQDLFGTTGNTTATINFTQLGSITPPMDAYGRVPEPSTYAQLGALLFAAGVVAWRRRSKQQV
jgi:hypothetical protein